jgi:hypothetical protein
LASPGGASADKFLKSQPGSVFNQLYLEKMTKESFLPFDKAITQVLQKDHYGYFWSKDTIISILVDQNHGCSVVLPWTSSYTEEMSMAMPKSSPYYSYFDHTLHQMMESGLIDALRSRWMVKLFSCPQNPIIAMDWNKVFTLFLYYAVAVCLSVLIYLAELLVRKSKQRSQGLRKVIKNSFKDDLTYKDNVITKRK